MNIRFVSSLTPEDEGRIAPALLAAAKALLAELPIAYTLRIETSGGEVFDDTRSPADRHAPTPAYADASFVRSLRGRP